MKRSISIIILVLLFIGAGVYWYLTSSSAKEAKPTITPIVVSAAKVNSMTIPRQIQAVGTLLANQAVYITPQVAGEIGKILFKEGSYVTAGTPLIQLDATILSAKVESSKASLNLARVEYQRAKKLAKTGAIPQQQLDQALATLKQQEAAVAIDQATLAKMTLVAPFDGVLGKREVSLGEYVTIGQKVLQIVATKQLRLTYDVPEKFLSELKLGQTVKLSTDALPKQKFSGKIIFISPAIDVSSHTVELQALVENLENRLRPGMFIKVTQELGLAKDALVVPEQCLVSSIEGQMVYKIVNGRAVATQVKIGNYSHGNVQILQGVKKGDMVISAGQQKLKDGSHVTIQSSKVS